MTKRSETKRVCKRSVGLLTAALLVVFASSAGAVPALETYYGSVGSYMQAEANSMAGTGAALYRGGLSAYLNPAFLTVETGTRMDGDLCLSQEHEDRFVPLYDSFDSLVRMTAIASNRHHYIGSGFGLAHRVEASQMPLVVGVSLNDRYDFRYDFKEEVRDPDSSNDPRDQILRQRTLEVGGVLRSLSLGIAAEPVDGLSGGLSLHYVFGTRAQTTTERYFFEPENSYNIEEDWGMSGVNFTLGGRYRMNERMVLGLALETALDVDGDYETVTSTDASLDTTSVEHAMRYPWRLRGGFTYTPRSNPRTVFTVDAIFSEWSEMEDSRLDSLGLEPRLEDTLDVRVGLEHNFYNEVALRFGFRHVDAFGDREASLSMFSAGTGAPVAGGRISVSVELGKISSMQDHLFAYDFPPNYWGGFTSPGGAQVEHTQFRVGVGYSLRF